ncbi:carbohydrate kinase family protein [Ruegeria marina]|uniref:Fructokinase n=1 Tax=Ruegeria marina TaxID=639004 RepID=A0A1G7E158_9RHOB|nr:carbohydrate kinase [Ruegeria marina]SDE57438.1 fructokinase [Ruegeria marina]
MILCCGEALVDMIPEPTVSGQPGFVPHPGGAVFNTAIALGRLGARVGLLTGLSRDIFGQQLRGSLVAANVDASLAILSDRPTTLAFVRFCEGRASYSFFDENSAGRMLTPADMPALPDEVSALFLGGISLACEPGAEAYAALVERESGRRAIMLDPNIRPGLVENAARYRARLARMVGGADIVKVSDEDLDWIVDTPRSQAEKARVLLDMGPSVVIVTRGAAGAAGILPGGTEVHVPARPAHVVDTVGAGDTFNAGVLATLSERGQMSRAGLAALAREDLQEAMQFGARVASVTVSRAGANPPWAHEI